MVSLVKEGLSNGFLGKRKLELGDHLLGSMPKYKQRRVSVIRDFPEMCGPNVMLVHSNGGNDVGPVENGIVGQEVNKEGLSVEKESQSPKAGLNSIEEADRSLISVVGTAVSSATDVLQDFTEEMETDVQPIGMCSPNVVEKEEADGVKDIDAMETFKESVKVQESLVMENVIEVEAKPMDKFRRRAVSAVRHFPPLCGPNLIGPTGQTLSDHLGRDGLVGLVASSVSKLETTSTETEIHSTESLESEFHIDKGETIVVSEGADKSMPLDSKLSDGNQEPVGKEMVLYSQSGNQESKSTEIDQDIVVENVREVVNGLMAETCSPWKEEKSSLSDSLGAMKDNKVKKDTFGWRGKAVAKKSILGKDILKRKSLNAGKVVDESSGSIIVKSSREYGANGGKLLEASSQRASSLRIDALSSSPTHRNNYEVILPPLNRKSSSSSDARNRVKDTLRTFQVICRKILRGEESKSETENGSLVGNNVRRIDLMAAKQIKKTNKEVNVGQKIIGAVPGVEVGDEFQYRVELALIGVHGPYQGGIDYLNRKGKLLALSIVASGGYADDMENSDVLIYSGQGGNLVGKNKNPEDQKLLRGNLALKNSIAERNHVRVIRGSKENKASGGSKENKASGSSDAKEKVVTTYVYDGLYTVDRYYQETGPHGKMVFMFELRKLPGQPELSWKQVKLSKKFKKRQGVSVDDISSGKETFPVCAVNTLNDEKPPSFTYITKVMYPDWFRPSIPKGCDCTGRCSASRKCSCAVKNGGEIPYNYNGAIVEAKNVVFECGPSCKCPPSCYNRVTQRGPSIQLEIFKTESRGWGVRSLSFIPSGTFICEYTGELLEDREAEKRTNDEYLFDIGRNLIEGDPIDSEEDSGYTIDAARYGNIGRFINHSCSPNLYAQNVLYDHEDPRMPHIMLFAAENIPALQELTYDYNYSVDQVCDSKGNIKRKNCYCGSTTCTGRMY